MAAPAGNPGRRFALPVAGSEQVAYVPCPARHRRFFAFRAGFPVSNFQLFGRYSPRAFQPGYCSSSEARVWPV